MKSVLISIHPQWCHKIIDGKKTIEARKTNPKIETPFKCYIYMTSGGYEWRDPWCTAIMPHNEKMYNGAQKVIGEFICDGIEILFNDNGNPINYMKDIVPNILTKTAMTYDELAAYVGGRGKGKNIYGWHISNLKIYDKPKEIGEFYHPCPNPEAFCEACKYVGHNPFDKEIECRAFVRCVPRSWMYVEEIK